MSLVLHSSPVKRNHRCQKITETGGIISSYRELLIEVSSSSEEHILFNRNKEINNILYIIALLQLYQGCNHACDGECSQILKARHPHSIYSEELEELLKDHRKYNVDFLDSEKERLETLLERVKDIHIENPYLNDFNIELIKLNDVNRMLAYQTISGKNCDPLLDEKRRIQEDLDNILSLIEEYRQTHALET
jgi:hypothetical protein